jgi:hypothetical protein
VRRAIVTKKCCGFSRGALLENIGLAWNHQLVLSPALYPQLEFHRSLRLAQSATYSW